MQMTVIRWVLGRIILLVDFLYRPAGVKRDVQEQAALDVETAKLSLYQFAACPFCVKVRWSMKRQSLNVETRDAKRNAQFADELVAGGGALKVPCLRIEEDNGSVTWMYESSDILSYLDQRFDLVAEPS
ncbi:MAG: glutathione S-transferase N-terminal domain-containing protein [Pseudomonadales bacterium]|nr:glutathione S-transferase N-terminal domain-containing protein [Pseudomonadales bacterium]